MCGALRSSHQIVQHVAKAAQCIVSIPLYSLQCMLCCKASILHCCEGYAERKNLAPIYTGRWLGCKAVNDSHKSYPCDITWIHTCGFTSETRDSGSHYLGFALSVLLHFLSEPQCTSLVNTSRPRAPPSTHASAHLNAGQWSNKFLERQFKPINGNIPDTQRQNTTVVATLSMLSYQFLKKQICSQRYSNLPSRSTILHKGTLIAWLYLRSSLIF